MDKSVLEILVCPLCKGKISYQKKEKELICLADGLAFPIRQGIPVMLVDQARLVPLDEVESLR